MAASVQRQLAIYFTAISLAGGACVAQAQELCTEAEVAANTCLTKSGSGKDDWIEAYLGTKSMGSPPKVSKFFDRVYYLLEDVVWTPDKPFAGIQKIVVPKGFVTDFASVPRIFWPILPPDDEYLLPAIVHDWLYWQQDGARSQADSVLEAAMKELKIAAWKVNAVSIAVTNFGGPSWEENAKLKAGGEKRILVSFPTSPTERWKDWKAKQPPAAR